MFSRRKAEPSAAGLNAADFSSPDCDQYLSFQSGALSITNRLIIHRNESSSVATIINADLVAPSQQLWALKAGDLHGVIKRSTVSITEAENGEAWASVHLRDELSEHHWLHINLLLPPSEFKELFHPIWIRQSPSQLRISLMIIGRHIPVEAAFSEAGDTTSTALEAGKRLPARLEMFEVTTLLAKAVPKSSE